MGEERKKKKGLGGLSPEKKKKLKQLIMQKAAEDLKNEAIKKKQEKDNYIQSKVGPLKIDGLDKGGLSKVCRDIYEKIKLLEEQKYDMEIKIRQQAEEIYELNSKCNDTKGKFVKPVLKKVSKTDSKLAKFTKKEKEQVEQIELKSTGKSKFALDEEDSKPAESENAAAEE